jgi:hypothetical protein
MTELEFKIKISSINLLEDQMRKLHAEITYRKADILQTWYGMKMESKAYNPWSPSLVFYYEDEIFLDVDHAMEYAEEYLNTATNTSKGG